MSPDHYYTALAEAVVRAWDDPTSPPDRIYGFLDFGLTYGPCEDWPSLLIDAWAVGKMPSVEGEWPDDQNITKLVDHCREYLAETGT
jgi:hypothetical protein